MNCETCGHYELKKMVTSGKHFCYSGEIPCFRCSRYSTLEDLHTNKMAQDKWIINDRPVD